MNVLFMNVRVDECSDGNIKIFDTLHLRCYYEFRNKNKIRNFMTLLSQLIYIILFLISVALSAFFSAAETAFMSLQRVRLQHMTDTGVKGAKQVARLLQKPERLLSTILLGDTFANTTAVVLGTAVISDYLGDHVSAIVTTLLLTGIVLMFGQSIPKTIATRYSEKLTTTFAAPIEFLAVMFTPFVFVLGWLTAAFAKLAGTAPVAHSFTSTDEIEAMIALGHKEGVVEKDEAEMLHNVFEFGDRPVREVMVRRLNVIAIESGSRVSDYFTLYGKSPFSRIPVFKDSLDNITGFVNDKDVLTGIAKGTVTPDTVIDELLRPPYFTPDSGLISKLFGEMRDNNYHMAVVVDEYGGTAGVVSLSRMAEEVVGEVRDELSSEQKDFEEINEYTFQVDGSMRIESVNEETGFELPPGDYETIAGFMLNRLGRIPKIGDQVRYKNLKLVVTKMRGVKIEEILITKEEHAAAAR
jgi:putative hemolysin